MLGFGPIGSAPIGGIDKRNARVSIWNQRRGYIMFASIVITAIASAAAILNSLPR